MICPFAEYATIVRQPPLLGQDDRVHHPPPQDRTEFSEELLRRSEPVCVKLRESPLSSNVRPNKDKAQSSQIPGFRRRILRRGSFLASVSLAHTPLEFLIAWCPSAQKCLAVRSRRSEFFFSFSSHLTRLPAQLVASAKIFEAYYIAHLSVVCRAGSRRRT